jgi:hypothetical protein
MSNPIIDLEIVLGDGLTGDKQNALTRLLSFILTTPERGRPFILSPGELRGAIRRSEGGEEVLNYEHPLLPDPAVSCASKTQLIRNLAMRFGMKELLREMDPDEVYARTEAVLALHEGKDHG